jgi:hypothetical protein
VFACVQSQ